MSDNNEKDFSSLRQLLALKRHEVPPPGYFEDFSSQVISRIKAGEARGGSPLAERLAGEATWLLRFMRFFEAKPTLVGGGLAAALCVVLLGGIFLSGSDTADTISMGQAPGVGMSNGGTLATGQPAPQLMTVASSGNSGGLAVTTNYSLQPVSSMFGSEPNPFNQPVSFTGGN
jgi:hypothetical protein